MFKSILMSACSLITLTAFSANAGEHDHHNHNHDTGSWMIGYNFEHTKFTGNKDGSSRISDSTLQSQYGEIPVEMSMDMHMFHIMYGATENLTLMVMPHYMKMRMLHGSSHGGGHSHVHEVEGFGDTEVSGLYSFYEAKEGNITKRANFTLGVSLPTGKTDVKFTNHHNNVYNLPYNMQFGSGTYDPILGISYKSQSPNSEWGVQTLNYIRLGKNDEGYRQGNKYTASAWKSLNLTNQTSLLLSLEGEAWENVSGQDRNLPVTAIAGADPKAQAGRRVIASVGLDVTPDKYLDNQKLSLSFGVPVYEHFDGPQPSMDYKLNIGWQLNF